MSIETYPEYTIKHLFEFPKGCSAFYKCDCGGCFTQPVIGWVVVDEETIAKSTNKKERRVVREDKNRIYPLVWSTYEGPHIAAELSNFSGVLGPGETIENVGLTRCSCDNKAAAA